MVISVTGGCSPSPDTDLGLHRGPVSGPAIASFQGEPLIRVRIMAMVPDVSVECNSPILIGSDDGSPSTQVRTFEPPVTISLRHDAFVITEGQSRPFLWSRSDLAVWAHDGTPLFLNGRSYTSVMRFIPVYPQGTQFDVVNELPIEQYLPGVLEQELYPRWHPAAYRAQAIAARSYALWERQLHQDRHYDLESSTDSQVFGGVSLRPRAQRAALDTRGQVLVYQQRVLPAFYSSCSGGRGQDGVVAFPGRVEDLPPLRGRRHGWGRTSPYYDWGPVERSRSMLSRRIATWGQYRQHPVGRMDGLRGIHVAGQSRTGRPVAFVILDQQGREFLLSAESFRFSVNFQEDGLTMLRSDQLLRSSNVVVELTDRSVRFTGGRGFGHGVGLCQWSAQEMAQHGYSERSILGFFYPTSQVFRVY